MQIRVVTAAGAAPTLAVAVNASGFQLAAAFAGRIGGWAIDDGPGLRSIYPIAAVLTVSGSALALHMLRRDRKPALESS
jgi:DHA1 family inner membrane transport protein